MGAEKLSVLWSTSVGGKKSLESSESLDSGRAFSSVAVAMLAAGVLSIQLGRGGVGLGGEDGWVAMIGMEVMFCCCATFVIDLVS